MAERDPADKTRKFAQKVVDLTKKPSVEKHQPKDQHGEYIGPAAWSENTGAEREPLPQQKRGILDMMGRERLDAPDFAKEAERKYLEILVKNQGPLNDFGKSHGLVPPRQPTGFTREARPEGEMSVRNDIIDAAKRVLTKDRVVSTPVVTRPEESVSVPAFVRPGGERSHYWDKQVDAQKLWEKAYKAGEGPVADRLPYQELPVPRPPPIEASEPPEPSGMQFKPTDSPATRERLMKGFDPSPAGVQMAPEVVDDFKPKGPVYKKGDSPAARAQAAKDWEDYQAAQAKGGK